MPWKKSRYGKKRNYRRKYKKTNRRRAKVYRPLPVVFPNRYRCKLKYFTTVSLTTTGGAARSSVCAKYRANSLYDPEVAVGGHQPLGFDQLCELFDHFTVIGSKIRVYPIHPSNASLNPPVFWGVALSDDDTALDNQTVDYIREQETVGRFGYCGLVNQTDPMNRPHKQFFSQKKFFNEPRTSFDTEYTCSGGADATELAYFIVYMINSSDANQTYDFAIDIEYIVQCHEPKFLAQS